MCVYSIIEKDDIIIIIIDPIDINTEDKVLRLNIVELSAGTYKLPLNSLVMLHDRLVLCLDE